MTDRSKKITELSLVSSAIANDVLVVVTNTATTPVTKKITVGALLANVSTNVAFNQTASFANVTVSGTISVSNAVVIAANGQWVGSPSGLKGDKGVFGDKGDTGQTGEKGQKGDYGSDGSKGDKGEKGTDGVLGNNGSKGDKGEVGDKGLQGETGLTGTSGDKGDQGSQGDTGDKGEIGDKGDIGAKGEIGDKGDVGAKGEIGDKGDKGDAGADGADGDVGAKGDTGAKGEAGSFGGQSFEYTYLSDTANTDPGIGGAKFNNATLASANKLFVDHIDADLNVLTDFIQTIDDSTSAIKGHFSVNDTSNSLNMALFAIVGNMIQHDDPSDGWFEVPIAYVSGTIALTQGTRIRMTLARAGDAGSKGDKGDTGSTGTTGAKGDTGTTGDKGDKGEAASVGDLTFNGTTIRPTANNTELTLQVRAYDLGASPAIDSTHSAVLQTDGRFALPTYTVNGSVYTTSSIGAANGTVTLNVRSVNPHVMPPSNATLTYEFSPIGLTVPTYYYFGSSNSYIEGTPNLLRIDGATDANVAIWANNNIWNFDTSGALTFPDNTIQTTAYTGTAGDKGDKGDTGSTGITGDKGDKGDTGPNLATTKFGYSSGASVTQLTARNQGVTINALSGEIYLVEGDMATDAVQAISMTNNTLEINDMIVCKVYGASFMGYIADATVIGTGQALIGLKNISGQSITGESPTIKFIVIKAPVA